MHISDGSSDVCSSDLAVAVCDRPATLVDDFLGDVIGRRSASAVVVPDRSTEIVDNDCGPLSCGRQRTFPPNSVAATRYQYDLAVQNAHYASFLLMLNYRGRSEEHTSELQSLMRISYAVFCLKKKNNT